MGLTGFPLVVNYLVGGENAYLEIGAGVVPAKVRITGQVLFLGIPVDGEKWTARAMGTLGFALQRMCGGFVFRIGLTRYTNLTESAFSVVVSAGYAF